MSVVTRKSDTHEERYVHLRVEHPRITHATVFLRREFVSWYGAVAYCHKDDQFERKIGRNTARRKYFSTGPQIYMGPEFSYDAAVNVALTMLPKAV